MRQTIAISAFAFLPTLVLSSIGILTLVYQRAAFDVVFGVLILIFSVAVLTGGIIVQAFLQREARARRLQTDFVSKVSHELRTPLASIRMFVDTLRGDDAIDDSERAMCLDVIATETSRLSSMVERLLAWGRMEAGRREYDLHPELVRTLVAEALAQAEAQFHAAEIRVTTEFPEADLAVRADRRAMVEALLNLLSNAVKYGGSGGLVEVRVRAERRRALVEVRDHGPGIPRSEHRRVFERFYRGASKAVAATSGSGLGLAMARLVVKAHGGSIRLQSIPGEGACFTVDLPALPDADAALEVRAE